MPKQPKPESNVTMIARLVKEFTGQMNNDEIVVAVIVVAINPDNQSSTTYRLLGDTMDHPEGHKIIAESVAESFRLGNPTTVRTVQGYRR